jgi:hypothetical protein
VKKAKKVVLLSLALLMMAVPLTALGATGELQAVSFRNAQIVEKFSPEKYDYTLKLTDPKATPTLKDYRLSGDANLFVTYSYDDARHQTGVQVTLEYASGSTIYSFHYQNAAFYDKSENNYLREIQCPFGVVDPAITRDTTDYRLYIPSDLTTLNLSAATEDIGAYCEMPTEIALSAEQELDIPVTVTASNGEKRLYSFSVKRTDKTTKEFALLVESGNTDILVRSERFYQKPAFLIAVLATAGAILLLMLLVRIAKRLTVEVSDTDEKEFFDTTE